MITAAVTQASEAHPGTPWRYQLFIIIASGNVIDKAVANGAHFYPLISSWVNYEHV